MQTTAETPAAAPDAAAAPAAAPAPAPKPVKQKFKLQNIRHAIDQMRRLAPYAFPYWTQLAVYFVFVGLYWAGYAGRFYILGPTLKLLNGAPKPGDTPTAEQLQQVAAFWNEATLIAIVLFASGVAMSIGTFGRQYMSAWLTNKATIDVQKDLALRIMEQPMSFFNKMRKGELMSRVSTDLNGVRTTFQILYNDMISDIVGVIVVSSTMIMVSPALALGLLVLPIGLAPVVIFMKHVKRVSKQSYEKAAELSNFFHQYFEGIRVVKAFGMEEQQTKELDRSAEGFFERSVKVGKYKGLSKAMTEVVVGAIAAGAIIAGSYFLSEQTFGDSVDAITMLAFVVLLIALYDPVRRISNTANYMTAATAANERVFELMDRIPEIKDRDDAPPAPDFSRDISFKQVAFEYDNGRPVLQEISFTAPKGSMTAFVGATGAGKSTLLDLIPRFYDPTAGVVEVDGVDLKSVTLRTWLAQIAIVSQETFLFNTTIRENLLAARLNASEEDCWQALEAANIADEVRSLPARLDTVLGDRGVNMSGGQRQRLAIARAFVKRAPILLLDEATSALDSETERKVQTALERLIQGATVFAIAHRLSTIMHADQILVLDQGRIVERGTHDELLAANGRYAMLYQTQLQSHA